ncbi:MAG: diversity-generating retroelement protein Avd [Burkholderiales bacterium]
MSESQSAARRNGPALEAMYRFNLWLMPAVEKLPRTYKFVLGDRMQIAALDCLERLIEATYTKSRDAALGRANLALEKLRFMFRLAYDLKLIDLKRFEHAAREIDEVGRLVGGWIRSQRAAQS